mgnify:CR=1 FL=1
MAANIRKLVADGFLDLDGLMSDRWDTVAVVAKYNGDRNSEEPHEVVLQIAISHGITAYRWADYIECEVCDMGSPMLGRRACVQEAKEYALQNHHEVGS